MIVRTPTPEEMTAIHERVASIGLLLIPISDAIIASIRQYSDAVADASDLLRDCDVAAMFHPLSIDEIRALLRDDRDD